MALFLLLLLLAAFAGAQAPPSCTAVPSVASCASSIISVISRTASASKFCSSVLGCPAPTTTTLVGTTSTTTTKTETSLYTWEELGSVALTTYSFSYTETIYTYAATATAKPTWTIERFEVTTVKQKKRREHENHFEARAVTSVCPSAVQQSACSCLYTCPGPVTKDNRRVIKTIETEISYQFTTVFVDYTETEYVPLMTTTTESLTLTTTKANMVTHTRRIKCTPSVSNPSFYLSATVSPAPEPAAAFNGKYVVATPDFAFLSEVGALFRMQYTSDKSASSVFTLDEKGRLVTHTSYGDHFSSCDNYGDFQLFSLMSRGFIQSRRGRTDQDGGWGYTYCTLQPPSGNFGAGYQELSCRHGGIFNMTVFQYCPIYNEWFNSGTVLGAEYSETTPPCFKITYLVVPVCG